MLDGEGALRTWQKDKYFGHDKKQLGVVFFAFDWRAELIPTSRTYLFSTDAVEIDYVRVGGVDTGAEVLFMSY